MLKKLGKWYLYAIGGFLVIAVVVKGLGLGGTPESFFKTQMAKENLEKMEATSKKHPNLMIGDRKAEDIIAELKTKIEAQKKAEQLALAKSKGYDSYETYLDGEAKKKAEAERIAKEKAKKKAEAERIAKEKEEQFKAQLLSEAKSKGFDTYEAYYAKFKPQFDFKIAIEKNDFSTAKKILDNGVRATIDGGDAKGIYKKKVTTQFYKFMRSQKLNNALEMIENNLFYNGNLDDGKEAKEVYKIEKKLIAKKEFPIAIKNNEIAKAINIYKENNFKSTLGTPKSEDVYYILEDAINNYYQLVFYDYKIKDLIKFQLKEESFQDKNLISAFHYKSADSFFMRGKGAIYIDNVKLKLKSLQINTLDKSNFKEFYEIDLSFGKYENFNVLKKAFLKEFGLFESELDCDEYSCIGKINGLHYSISTKGDRFSIRDIKKTIAHDEYKKEHYKRERAATSYATPLATANNNNFKSCSCSEYPHRENEYQCYCYYRHKGEDIGNGYLELQVRMLPSKELISKRYWSYDVKGWMPLKYAK